MFGVLCAPFCSHYSDQRGIWPAELPRLLGHGHGDGWNDHLAPVLLPDQDDGDSDAWFAYWPNAGLPGKDHEI